MLEKNSNNIKKLHSGKTSKLIFKAKYLYCINFIIITETYRKRITLITIIVLLKHRYFADTSVGRDQQIYWNHCSTCKKLVFKRNFKKKYIYIAIRIYKYPV